MLKFLLVIILIGYAFYKVGGYLFKLFFIGAAEASDKKSNFKKRAPNSNLDIDSMPSDLANGKGYKGGEYVDFEEVDK